MIIDAEGCRRECDDRISTNSNLAEVEVIIINYRRPRNVAEIVPAIHNQSLSVKITIVDASPDNSLPASAAKIADRVIRLERNYGGYNRYVNASQFDKEFSFFIDDDILPGRRCVESFLSHALAHPEYGVLGQAGRIVVGGKYNVKNHRAKKDMLEVDFVVKGYFVRREILEWQKQWKQRLELKDVREDDLLVCSAAQRAGFKVGVIPVTSVDEKMDVKHLPAPFATSGNSKHISYRTAFIQNLLIHGWLPLSSRR